MKIDTIKDLESLVAMCRRKGVRTISVDGVTIELGDAPAPKRSKSDNADPVTEKSYSDDELAVWSAHG